MQTAIRACASGGRVVLVGMGQDDMELPMTLASVREVDIFGSWRYCNTVSRETHQTHPAHVLMCSAAQTLVRR